MQQIWNTWTWTKVGAQNRPATCPQGSWWVGHNQKKTWIARTLASGRRHTSWFEDFRDPVLPRFWLGSFLRLLIFPKHIGKKNEKTRKFGQNLASTILKLAALKRLLAELPLPEAASWRTFCARTTLPRSKKGRRRVAGAEALPGASSRLFRAEEAPPGASSGQLT